MVYGMFRGLIVTVFGIAGIVMAVLLAKDFGVHLAYYIRPFVGDSLLTVILGYGIIFLMVITIFLVLSALLRHLASRLQLGVVDKVGGLIFGVVRGLFFMSLIVLMLAATPVTSTASWFSSYAALSGGFIIKSVLHIPIFKGYKKWIAFDYNDRPKIGMESLFGGQADETRQETIHSLEEELAKQSAAGANDATKSKLTQLKKQQEAEKQTSTNALFEKIECLILEKECAKPRKDE